MIRLHEQFGYKRTGFLDITDKQKQIFKDAKVDEITIPFSRKNKNEVCLCMDVESLDDGEKYHFETSYFIGVDWLIEGKQPVFVEPKLNDEDNQVDFLAMLFEALEDPINIDHLDDLYHINFNSLSISISQDKDQLTPFLLIGYLQLLKQIVRKGLKKSYFKTTENIESKIKGKILINKTICENLYKGKLTKTYCQFNEYGIDSIENRILKKALKIAKQIVSDSNYKNALALKYTINYIMPAFEAVSDKIDLRDISKICYNPVYKEYKSAIEIAICLLKKEGYNQNTRSSELIKTPPYWIDMSKLFELYVFKKLREIFFKDKEIVHQFKTNRLEIDYLIKSEFHNLKMVVDAKYKPRYFDEKVITQDIRQISGYARLNTVYKDLNVDPNQTIDCLIIYSNQKCAKSFSLDQFFDLEKVKDYNRIYKLGIKLPILENW